jgi:hypothetical protein
VGIKGICGQQKINPVSLGDINKIALFRNRVSAVGIKGICGQQKRNPVSLGDINTISE